MKRAGMIDDVMEQMQQEALLDSRGEFSLDLRAEARKMAQFVQEEPGLWLLKGVQAAVASGADEVRIRLSRARFELWFEPASEAGLASLESESNWCRHLRTAVTLALAGPCLGLELNHGEHGLLGAPATSPGVCLRVLRPRRPWWQFSDPQLAAVSRGLSLRCAFCPIVVRVDHRDILLGAPEKCPLVGSSKPRLSFGEGVTPVPWLGEVWDLVEGGPGWSLEAPIHRAPAEVWAGGDSAPGQLSSGPLATHVSSLNWLRSPVEVRKMKALDHGPNVRMMGLLESLRAGALSQLSTAKVVGLGLALERLGKNDFVVDQLAVAEVASEQLVPGKAEPWKMTFPKVRCQRWVGLCSSGRGRGGLFLVQDGVLLNPLRDWSLYEGTTALVATSGQATDLGQLNPVHDGALDLLLERARQDEAELAVAIKRLVFTAAECERLQVPLATREHWRRLLA